MSRRSDIGIGEDEWFKGEKKTLNWTIDDEGNPEAVPPGMDDWTMVFVMRQRPESSWAALQLNAEVVDASEGTVKVEVVHTNTVSLPSGEYFYTLARTDTENEQVLAYGAAVLQQPAALQGVSISAPMAEGGGSL